MTLTEKEVEHVARLARLGLSPTEKKLYQEQLSRILDYAEEIKKLDTEKVEPTYHSLPLQNVLRKDVVKQDVDPGKLIAQTPSAEGNFYSVPKILD